MKQKKYNIGISCIGSGVGQSVINSLNLSRLPMKTIGLGTNPLAYGLYDCDTYDYTLSIYNQGYIDDLIEKCLAHKIDLLIPGLDDEALLYAQNAAKFSTAGIKVLVAGEELISICRDKERMSLELNKIADVFVKSYDKNTLSNDIESGLVKFPFIAKPRGGFASRGVEIIRSEEDLLKITDDHIIQELAIPVKTDPNHSFYISQISKNINPQVSEVSIQLVYDQRGQIMGRMFSYNKLNNGVPIEIIPYDNDYIWSMIDKLTPAFIKMGLRGPLNIQGRLTENGLKLFEMNPRFTGITGLRALMGFNEVEACVKEWLEIDKGNNKLQFNYNRFGIRQTADKSIPIERNNEVLNLFKQINGAEIKKKKTILITGASGYLGQNLIQKLSLDKTIEIWAFVRNKEKAQAILSNEVAAIFDNGDLENGRINLGNVDILLHLGFSRPHCTNQQIAESLKFTQELFTRAVSNHLPAIINISSQSVYGLQNTPPWTEETPVSPETVYGQAKFATELLLNTLSKFNKVLRYTSLRLGALSGGADGLVETDFLSKMAREAFDGNPINVVGGMQEMERLDIRDAVDAIIKMTHSKPENWEPVYNLGSGQVNKLKDIVETTIEAATKLNGGKRSKVFTEKKEITMKFGLDSSLFYADMNWRPAFDINDTIESLISYFQNGRKKI